MLVQEYGLYQPRYNFMSSDVYKERLAKNDWLTPETRDKAIVKLNVIKPYIGYPEELPERYKDKVVDETASLFENALAFARVEIQTGR